LKKIGKALLEYTYDCNNECYVEFGEKEGDCTPAFSMKILPAESSGRMKLELDFEIDDNDERQHRACFFIQSELGMLDKLGKSLQSMSEGKIEECTLYEE
jgi:hypothetical protein